MISFILMSEKECALIKKKTEKYRNAFNVQIV